MMQNSLFYDYYALIDSCSFLKKYDALFRANTKHNNPKNPNRKLDKTTKIKRNPMATLSYYSVSQQ